MHIYAFGSVCRGQVDLASDIDLLAIVDGYDKRFDHNKYSIYSYKRIQDIWQQGNPFAWHLSKEAKLIYADDRIDFLNKIGQPAPYLNGAADCLKFEKIFLEALKSISLSAKSYVFDLSSIFLALRNFATCYSLAFLKQPNFSRHSAMALGTESLEIGDSAYEIFMRARLLCTRGIGTLINAEELELALSHTETIQVWMRELLQKRGICCE